MIAQDSTRIVNAAAADRSLAPREHGAYGQLGLPLIATLAMAPPTVSAILLALGAALIFASHEPFLLLLGRRGLRAQRYGSARARRALHILVAAAALAGGLGLALAPRPAQLAALVPLTLGAALVTLIYRDQEKTFAGEALAASALASASIPVALALGIPSQMDWGAWLTWTVSFAAATWAVRAVIRHRKFGMTLTARLLPILASAALTILLCWSDLLSRFSAAATAPILVFSTILAIAPPHPSALRRVGFTLLAASALTAAILIIEAHI